MHQILSQMLMNNELCLLNRWKGWVKNQSFNIQIGGRWSHPADLN